MTAPQWPPPPVDAWDRSPATSVQAPLPKWNYDDRRSSQKVKEKDRDRDRERDKDRDRKRNNSLSFSGNRRKEKEKDKVCCSTLVFFIRILNINRTIYQVPFQPEEENKPLDLDTRIALLLKEKGSGGMAPPFLALGGDSDDESKSVLDKLSDGPSLIQRSRRALDSDSDDDRSSISLSDMPINPPAPDFLFGLDRICTREDEEKQPLSTPPSPFLSKEIYVDCHRLALEQVIRLFKFVV